MPKWSVLQPYFRWAGIDGVTNPFMPEVVINHDLLPMEWPFTVAHEWGHLAGLAHEAEASYAGWLTCQAGTDQTRYSAALWAFGHVFAASPRESSNSGCPAAWVRARGPTCAPLHCGRPNASASSNV